MKFNIVLTYIPNANSKKLNRKKGILGFIKKENQIAGRKKQEKMKPYKKMINIKGNKPHQRH